MRCKHSLPSLKVRTMLIAAVQKIDPPIQRAKGMIVLDRSKISDVSKWKISLSSIKNQSTQGTSLSTCFSLECRPQRTL